MKNTTIPLQSGVTAYSNFDIHKNKIPLGAAL